MTIEQLIEKLENVRDMYGDSECIVCEPSSEYVAQIVNVVYSKDCIAYIEIKQY